MRSHHLAYELDDGDLTDAQLKLIRDYVSQNYPFNHLKSSFSSSLLLTTAYAEKLFRLT